MDWESLGRPSAKVISIPIKRRSRVDNTRERRPFELLSASPSSDEVWVCDPVGVPKFVLNRFGTK